MNTTEWKHWTEMTEEERDEFVALVHHVMEPDPDDQAWRGFEEMDAYREAVQEHIGRSEEDLLAQAGYSEDDLDERFHAHCDRAFRRGLSEAACARQWLCRPP
jgi:hypothetical protein